MGVDRMEPGASANAPPNLDLPPLKEPGLKQNDLQTLQLQAVQNRRPGQVLPLHAIDNSAPRKEFLTSQCSFGRRPAKVSSQAYLDTLSSFSFVAPQLLQRIQRADAQGITWKTTDEYVEFGVAVGKETHKAPIVRLELSMDSFRVLNWQQRTMILQDATGSRHTVHGDGDFIQARRLDLI
eukprot:scaffold74_cov346-Pavlova_lutheri.AAC.1